MTGDIGTESEGKDGPETPDFTMDKAIRRKTSQRMAESLQSQGDESFFDDGDIKSHPAHPKDYESDDHDKQDTQDRVSWHCYFA